MWSNKIQTTDVFRTTTEMEKTKTENNLSANCKQFP